MTFVPPPALARYSSRNFRPTPWFGGRTSIAKYLWSKHTRITQALTLFERSPVGHSIDIFSGFCDIHRDGDVGLCGRSLYCRVDTCHKSPITFTSRDEQTTAASSLVRDSNWFVLSDVVSVGTENLDCASSTATTRRS